MSWIQSQGPGLVEQRLVIDAYGAQSVHSVTVANGSDTNLVETIANRAYALVTLTTIDDNTNLYFSMGGAASIGSGGVLRKGVPFWIYQPSRVRCTTDSIVDAVVAVMEMARGPQARATNL